MAKIKNKSELKFAIGVLEAEQKKDFESLKIQIFQSINGFNPLSIIKNSLFGLNQSANVNDTLIGDSVGVLFRYFSRYILIGNSINPLKHLLINILQSSFSHLIKNNPSIAQLIQKLFYSFITKKLMKNKKNE